MFAAAGDNGSFYVICQAPGDCTLPLLSDPSELQVSGVGGTSASAPAFAGMMALVNQLYGPQGQANTVLDPLAQRVPSAFHDIAIGSNNAPCDPTFSPSVECKADATGGTYSIGGFSATPGYDMATGLGSVDAYQLVTNWNKVTLNNSSTQLIASSRRLEHGDTVTLETVVSGSSSGAKPTGNVALVTNLPQYASRGLGVIALDSTGTGTLTTNQLPGGRYNLTAQYSGDSQFNGSESQPITLDIGPESSVIQPTTSAYAVTYSAGQPTLTNLGPIKNGAVYPYGTYFFVDLKVAGSHEPSTTVGTPATGSTTIFDNGTPLSTNSLDVTGSSSYSNLALPVGPQSLQYSYSGDSSYLPTTATSPSGALNFTVAKAPSQISGATGSQLLFKVGGSYAYLANVSGPGGGAPPTGKVTFQLGDLPPQTVDLRANLGATNEPGSGVSFAGAYYSNLPAGTYTMKVSYTGDQNLSGSTLTGTTLTVAGDGGLLPATVAVTFTSSAGSGPIVPSTVLNLNITVSGGKDAKVAPTGYYAIVDDTTLVGLGLLPSSSTGTVTIQGKALAGQLLAGVNHLVILYVGDANYLTGFSPPLDYTMTAGDFTLAATTQDITLHSGGFRRESGLVFVQLQGLNQFSGPVNLSCKVTGGPVGNSVMPRCFVPSATLVQSVRSSTAIVRVDAGPGDHEGSDWHENDRVPPGTYTAVITGMTAGALHDVPITITVK